MSFSSYKTLKFFEIKFFGFKKIGSKLVKFWVCKILTKIWPKCIFFGNIFYSSELDLSSFNFRVFFLVWQFLEIAFFSGVGLEKLLKLVEFLSSGKLDHFTTTSAFFKKANQISVNNDKSKEGLPLAPQFQKSYFLSH